MTKKYTLTALLALMLLTVAPSAFADSGQKDEHRNFFGVGLSERFEFWKHHDVRNEHKKNSDERRKEHGNVTLVGTVTQVAGSTITLTSEQDVTYMVTIEDASIRGGVASDITVGDNVVVWGALESETLTAKRLVNITELRASSNLGLNAIAGVVTSIDASSFTIDPVGVEATTTVEFTSDTEFMKKHKETSLSSLLLGSHVLVKGTTETSTEGDTFVADIVKIFEKGFGNLTFWFWAK